MKRPTLLVAVLGAAVLAVTVSSQALDPNRSTNNDPRVPKPQDPFNPFTIPQTSGTPSSSTGLSSSIPPAANPTETRNRARTTTIPEGTQGIEKRSNQTTHSDHDHSGSAAGTSRIAPNYLPPGETQPPGQNRPPRWRLGVYSKDTDTGVQIMQVVPQSAADHVGLEVNDKIVCVNGFQVGYVNGVPYDCSYEFERNADADGWVTLLVHNHRDGSLVNIPVQLNSRYETIEGSITYREFYTLPQNAVATVELREILRPGAPPVTLARKSVYPISQIPIPYEIEFDPSQIDSRRQYVLHATITSGDQTLFTTRRDVPVMQNGQMKNVALLVESEINTRPGNQYLSRDQQIEQIVQYFREYLHRDPRSYERLVWQSHIDRGGSLADAQASILSMPEFYNQCNANEVEYIRQLHTSILGKEPTPEEINYWLGRMKAHNNLRPEVAREFLAAVGVQR